MSADEPATAGPPRRTDQELAGHWSSAPFDYGAMESSELGFLPDGGGWSVWANAAGGLTVTRFSWCCPEPGLLQLDARRITSGEGQEAAGSRRFASVDTDEPCQEVTRTRYTVAAVPAPDGGEPVQALLFEEPVEFSYRYARGERDIHPGQDPAHTVRRTATP